MSSDAPAVAVAALMDAISLLRGEVAALARSNARVEEAQQEIHRRLDVIDTGLAPIASLLPFQEAILAKTIEGDDATHTWMGMLVPVLDRIVEQSDGQRDMIGTLHQDVVRLQEVAVKGHQATTGIASGLEAVALTLTTAVDQNRKQQSADFVTTGELIGFTRMAVLGDRVPLPVHLEDNPMLERFLLTQPADLTSTDRALVDWRSAAAAASTEDLIALLRKQQTPSPTDTPQTRIMRYRLAAIARAQIEGRGAVPPARPATTRATDRSAAACWERSQELAELWREGESAALYAEPELAGAIDLFEAAERQIGSAVGIVSPPELVRLHRDLADRIEAGERPIIEDGSPDPRYECATAVERGQDR